MNRRYFVCYIGKNAKGEKRYGLLGQLAGSNPPIYRLMTKNAEFDDTAEIASAMNAVGGMHHQIEDDESNELFGNNQRVNRNAMNDKSQRGMRPAAIRVTR